VTANPKILRRYTDVPALLYLLNRKAVTLLDPVSWEDTNDSHYLSLYKGYRRLGCLLALCFTQAGESYHHWRVFANGAGGVCVQFDRVALLAAVKLHDGIRARSVKYLTLSAIRSTPPSARNLPFVKRYAYAHEKEFRIIYESHSDDPVTLDIPVVLDAIVRITLSPWIQPTLSAELRKMLKAIPGCSHLEVARSTLIGNDEWKRLGENAARSASTRLPTKSLKRRRG